MLSVLVVSIDRLDELERCLNSLHFIADVIDQVIVLENNPAIPWSQQIKDRFSVISSKVTIIQASKRLTCAESRNYMATFATAPYLFVIDDDAFLLNDEAILRGIELLENDRSIGAIALAQCDAEGNLPPGYVQPAPRDQVCLTCGFSGYGNIIRRDLYLAAGGFQEIFEVAGEENEMCRRLWASGYSIIWVPDRSICHIPSEVDRDMSHRAMLTARNRVLDGFLNEPCYLLPVTLPFRVFRAFMFLRGSSLWHHQSTGRMVLRACKSFVAVFPRVVGARRPIPLKYHLRWEKMKRNYPLYDAR